MPGYYLEQTPEHTFVFRFWFLTVFTLVQAQASQVVARGFRHKTRGFADWLRKSLYIQKGGQLSFLWPALKSKVRGQLVR